MADPRAMKRNLLQDLMQRARSSTNVGGVKFLSSNNPTIKGTRSNSLKSPKIKTARTSNKRLHLPSVFRSHKEPSTPNLATPESKSDSLKENARRRGGGKNKRPKSYCEEEKSSSQLLKTPTIQPKQNSEVSEKRDKTLAEKVLQTITEKHTPKKEKSKLSREESLTTPQHVLYTTYQENNLKTLLQSEERIAAIPWKQNKTIPASPGKTLTTKVTYCHSCGHVEAEIEEPFDISKKEGDESQDTTSKFTESSGPVLKKELKVIEKESTVTSKSPEVTKKKCQLVRSNSDPTSSPRKDQRPRILYKHRREVKRARITQTQTFQQRTQITRRLTDSDLLDGCNEQTAADLEQWKLEIQQNSVFLESTASFSDEVGTKQTMSKLKSNNIEDACPLLKTKIPEEFIQEDGSVTLRKGNTEGQKRPDADRDSGVEIDNAGKTYQRLNSNDSEIDIDQEQTATPDSLLEPTAENDTQEFDFDTLKKSNNDAMTKENTDETEVDASTLKRRPTFFLEEKAEWDMYALLRRFECVEWELTPASNLKRQTLDLDNCDLDSVPAAVTEIEYYAFRDVEAVSLNHNRKIENADVLGKLADLRVINMWGCNLQSIPQTWSRLTKLQMLGLGNNKNLSNFGPLKHLTNVVWLDLGGCGLKQIPDEVTNMMKLKVLALGGNPGLQIGDEICSLWDLKKLGLNDCELEEIPRAVFSLIKLTHLHLDNNYIRHIDQEVVQLTELEELTVTGNDSIIFPKILSQCDTISCIIVDQSRDLSRVSGTLKNRMRQMPTAISPARQPPPKARHATVS